MVQPNGPPQQLPPASQTSHDGASWRSEWDSNCRYHHLLGRRIRTVSPFTDGRVMIGAGTSGGAG